MLLNAGMFMGMLTGYRICTIEGRFGSYKTALAFALAGQLLEKGYAKHIVANIPSVWRDKPRDIPMAENGQVNTVIILDEGGIFLQDTRTASQYINFMRKMNIYLLIPSAETPASRVRNLIVQRTVHGMALGLPFNRYGVTLNQGKIKENISFDWWFPSEIFGIYDTGSAPVSDGGIRKWLQKWTDEYRSRFGDPDDDEYSTDLFAPAGGGVSASLPEVEELRGVIADLAQEARLVGDAVSVLEQQGRKGRHKR